MMFILSLALTPFVIADGAEGSSNPNVNIEEDCSKPVIYYDPTNRITEPNDQTLYTADIYGVPTTNVYGHEGYSIPYRQNYAFTGETVSFYIAVYDEDGADDIDEVLVLVDDEPVGSCTPNVWQPGCLIDDLWINNHYNIPYDPDDEEYDSSAPDATDHLFAFYRCQFIVQSGWTAESELSIFARDGELDVCLYPNEVTTIWDDFMNFNPSLELDVLGGPVDFGTIEPGSRSISNSVYLRNNASDGSGVVMDMYIAADDYFTDPTNPEAICPTGNGIRYDQFRYYATKGSVNSGPNDNAFRALATNTAEFEECNDIQDGEWDEFVQLPSYSGDIRDMCHIINWDPDGNPATPNELSLLTQGSEMSITFKLIVPDICEGHFTDGQFRFAGRVV